MKNFLQSVVSSTKQRKLAITNELRSPGNKSYIHDSLVDELNITLKAYETSANEDRVVYDCNRNNITENPELKRSSFRRKSWRRKSSSKKGKDKTEKTAEAVDDKTKNSISSDTDSVKKDSPKPSEKDAVQRKKESNKTHQRSLSESANNKTEKVRRYSESPLVTPKTEKRKQRRFSTNTTRKISQTLFEDKTTPNSTTSSSTAVELDVVDFGGCYLPYEMKSWALIQQKLASWGNRSTSSSKLPAVPNQQPQTPLAHKRNFSFSDTFTEPAKWMVNTLPTTLKRNRKKSYEFQRKPSGSISSTENLDEPVEIKEENVRDISLTREIIEPCFAADVDISFSSNVWYYGELDIRHESTTSLTSRSGSIDSSGSSEIDDDQEMSNKIGSLIEQGMRNLGTLLARIDKHGDIVYSITYSYESHVYVGSIPFQNGRYCLDFSDKTQPRFSSVKFLLAYLIEESFLQRVSFAWLLENCYSLIF